MIRGVGGGKWCFCGYREGGGGEGTVVASLELSTLVKCRCAAQL